MAKFSSIESDKVPPWELSLVINSVRCDGLLMDTGAEETLLTAQTWNRIGKPPLQPTTRKGRSFTAHSFKLLGMVKLQVKFNDQVHQLKADKHLKYTRCVDNGDRKFPCPLCSRSFEKRDRLRIHVLHVHENHRPHVCSVCGKAFSQSSSLNKHLRVHSGERPYHCPHCTKSFTASSILRTHIRQHSGEKPFKCAFCGKSFASHAAHDSHVRRTHSALS